MTDDLENPAEPIDSYEIVAKLRNFDDLLAWLDANSYKVGDAKAIEMLRLPDDP